MISLLKYSMAVPSPIRGKLKFKKKEIIEMKLRKSHLVDLKAFVIHLRDWGYVLDSLV